eukprot:gene14504-14626_t
MGSAGSTPKTGNAVTFSLRNGEYLRIICSDRSTSRRLDGSSRGRQWSLRQERLARMPELSTPVVLTDAHVELRPLHPDHLDGLIAAASDGELWKLWYTLIPEPQHMAAEIERRLELQAKGQMVPFTVVTPADGRIVGMTTYMHIDA